MIKIFCILLFFLFFNVNNSHSTATVEIPDKTTQSIADNILSGNNKEEVLTPISDEYYKPFKSFMFSDNILHAIQKALVLHNNKGKVIVDENNSTEESGEEIATFDESMKNVYLKAIMYISNNNWSVWINDKKISNKNNLDEDNEYIIKRINTKEAIILLNVSKTKWNYLNSSGIITNDKCIIDDEKNKVNFEIKLHPNQTFIFSQNSVIDGKYKGEVEKLIDSIDNNELDLFLNEEFNFDELQ